MNGHAASQRLLLATLAQGQVDFVLIGGHAVAAHGYERATRDVDIVYSREAESCARFATTLEAIDATVLTSDSPAPGDQIAAEWLAEGGHFVFGTAHGQLDALSWTAGLDFAGLESRADTAELADGTQIKVCSYEDLVKMKQTADRPRDQEDLRELARVREP